VPATSTLRAIVAAEAVGAATSATASMASAVSDAAALLERRCSRLDWLWLVSNAAKFMANSSG
jgi:hypothetical protein